MSRLPLALYTSNIACQVIFDGAARGSERLPRVEAGSSTTKLLGMLWHLATKPTALYLRNFFPRVKCWAFSPPGGLADPNVADAAQDFCTSVVLGKDWIPRLTVGSFARLRDEMVRTPLSKLGQTATVRQLCHFTGKVQLEYCGKVASPTSLSAFLSPLFNEMVRTHFPVL